MIVPWEKVEEVRMVAFYCLVELIFPIVQLLANCPPRKTVYRAMTPHLMVVRLQLNCT
jgi:hypothetical protein